MKYNTVLVRMISGYHLLCIKIILPAIFGVADWGFKQYIKYEPGEMNLIITVPHGGSLDPTTQSNGRRWPYRKNGCEGTNGECIWTHGCGLKSAKCIALIKRDDFTMRIARDIANEIKAITGFRPHVVYNMLRRTKLDANREIDEATFNISDAITAYHDYASFINKARSSITGREFRRGTGRGLLLDIHGSADHLQRTVLGYLVHGKYLDRGDYSMDMSSIRSLGKHWCGTDNVCFKEFVQGNRSLGYFMNQQGLLAIPSPQSKKTKSAVRIYLSGGYTVAKFGSRDGGNVDGIQLEFSRALRSRWNNSATNKVVRAILNFCKFNY